MTGHLEAVLGPDLPGSLQAEATRRLALVTALGSSEQRARELILDCKRCLAAHGPALRTLRRASRELRALP